MDHDQLGSPGGRGTGKRAGMDVPREERGGRGHTPRQPTDSPLYPLLSAAAEFYKQALKSHPARKAAVNYLKGRGLTGEIARDFGLGFARPAGTTCSSTWVATTCNSRPCSTPACWWRTATPASATTASAIA